jgi:predicted nucleic acid-binding protein
VIAYFDTSAIVKLVKDEEGSDLALELWSGADAVLTSQLTYPEARSALRRPATSTKLSAKHAAAVRALASVWSAVSASDVDPDVAVSAGELVDRHHLRGADAIHLSTALAARGEDFVFVTWDRRLAQSALAEGLPVAPA